MKSIEWARLVMADQDLSANAVNVACVLALHSKRVGPLSQSNVTNAQLSTRSHLSPSSCRRALRELVEAGWVSVVKRRNKHGKQGASDHYLIRPEPVDNSVQSVTQTVWPECHSDSPQDDFTHGQSVTVTPLQGKDSKVYAANGTSPVETIISEITHNIGRAYA